MNPFTVMGAGAALALVAGGALSAPVPSVLGTWTIAGSQRAPWAMGDDPADTAEMKRLTGSRVVFARDRISAPAPLNCRGPHYEVHPYTVDMLFQGGLTAPRRQAAALGFAGPTVSTVETGCEGAIDFHFVDARTAMFALNNRIYTMKRAAGR